MTRISMAGALGKGYNRFFHSRHFYRVVKGSRGSKKSKNTALCYIHDILKYSWANLLVVRRYSNANKQSTYTDLKWAAHKLKVSHLLKFNESMPEITVKATGQKMLFRGLDDPLKITSISVDVGILSWVWIEEGYQVETQDKFDTLIESIRGAYNAPDFFKQVTITFNPWSEKHWLKREFFDEETRRKNTFSDTTTFEDNEFLDEQDRERFEDIRRTNPRRARIVCNGEWGVAEGLVFDNWIVEDFDIQDTIKRVGVTAHGMDFGFSHDPTTLPELIVDIPNKVLYVYGELYKTGLLAGDIFREIQKRNLIKAKIIADNEDPRMITQLQVMGVSRMQRSIKGQGSVRAGIDFMQGFKIIIHPSCERTAEEFGLYSYKQDKEGNWLNEPVDENNHIIDGMRYALEPFHLHQEKDKHKEKQAIERLRKVL